MRRWLLVVLLSWPLVGWAAGKPKKDEDDDDDDDTAADTTTADLPITVQPLTGRLSLTAGALWELGSNAAQPAALSVPSQDKLAWGDIRGYLDGQRVDKTDFDVRADFRLRLTPGGLSDAYSRKITDSVTTARGYTGGDEYDLREMYVGYELSGDTRLLLGRQIVLDADATTIDGLRIQHRFARSWSGEVFGGLFPDPFSRTLQDDYPNGFDAIAVAGGADVSYQVPSTYGALALAVESFMGDAGGRGVLGMAPTWSNQLNPPQGESPRVFLYWQNYWRPKSFLDVYNYVVLDAVSEAGAQVTEGHLAVNLRPSSSFRLELSFSRMSTYAAEIYLKRYFLREPDATFTATENNLQMMRMAQNEGRLLANFTFDKQRFVLYFIGRYLNQNLVEQLDPRFNPAVSGHTDAIDLTAGVRDTRSIGGLRLGASATKLYGYRTEVTAINFDAQREFGPQNAAFVQLQVGYMSWHDDDFDQARTMCDPTNFNVCYGATDGSDIDVGAALAYHIDQSWFVIADYHLVLNNSQTKGEMATSPTLFTNIGFFRIQYRF